MIIKFFVFFKVIPGHFKLNLATLSASGTKLGISEHAQESVYDLKLIIVYLVYWIYKCILGKT